MLNVNFLPHEIKQKYVSEIYGMHGMWKEMYFVLFWFSSLFEILLKSMCLVCVAIFQYNSKWKHGYLKHPF